MMSELEQLNVADPPRKRKRRRTTSPPAPKPQHTQAELVPKASSLPQFVRIVPDSVGRFVGWAHQNLAGYSLVEIDYLTNDISTIQRAIGHRTLIVIRNTTDHYMDGIRQQLIRERAELKHAQVVFVSHQPMKADWIKLWNF